jgi:hypothetical protein
MGNFAKVADVIHMLISKPQAVNGFDIEKGLNKVSYDSSTRIFTVVDKGRKVLCYDTKTRKGSTTLNNYGCGIVAGVIDEVAHDLLFVA